MTRGDPFGDLRERAKAKEREKPVHHTSVLTKKQVQNIACSNRKKSLCNPHIQPRNKTTLVAVENIDMKNKRSRYITNAGESFATTQLEIWLFYVWKFWHLLYSLPLTPTFLPYSSILPFEKYFITIIIIINNNIMPPQIFCMGRKT